MGRPGGPGPLDPIFDVDTIYGQFAFDNTPGVTPLTVTINQAASQPDPTSTTPIVFDVVFSEAVTGFATGDVTLSGTAGGTLIGAVSGAGTTFTVSVTGMTTNGTVTATIAASKCTAVATGIANRASTSTDNTVTWQQPVLQNVVAHYDESQGLFGTDRIGSYNLTDTAIQHVAFGSFTGSQSNGSASSRWQGAVSGSPIDGLSIYGVTVIAGSWNANSGPTMFDARGSSGATCFGLFATSDWHIGAATFAPWDGGVHVFYFEFNGNSSKVFIDGVQVGTTHAAGTTTAGAAYAFLNVLGGGNNASITIGEAKVTAGTQIDAAILAESVALHAKWGV